MPEIVPTTEVPKMGESILKICICHPDDLEKIVFVPVSGQNYHVPDPIRSPLLELNRCFFDGKHLRRGRLYFISHFFNEEGVKTSKGKQYVSWAKSLLNRAVEGLTKDLASESFVGLEAESLRSSGKCEFVV